VVGVSLHPETRNTILFKSLDRLWESHKLIYIGCSFVLILLLIAAIVYVLTTVVVPSERYHFLEQKEAEELRQYLRKRTFGDVLLPMAFI
jgi:Na+-transporting methylmalonyl-CoA/oxaloacetate decarboxylase gamma subunit